jgi:hypothetical protein
MAKRGMSWNQVVEQMAERYRLAEVTADGFELVWELAVEGLEPVVQPVSATVWEGFGEVWIEVSAPIVSNLGAREAIELTGGNLIGSIGIAHGGLVVRHTAPLASLTGADLERILEWVGREAAALSRPAPAASTAPVAELFCIAM